MSEKRFFIVVEARNDEEHTKTINALRPLIGDTIHYIDIAPHLRDPDKDEIDEGLYLKVNE